MTVDNMEKSELCGCGFLTSWGFNPGSKYMVNFCGVWGVGGPLKDYMLVSDVCNKYTTHLIYLDFNL